MLALNGVEIEDGALESQATRGKMLDHGYKGARC